MLSGIAGSEFLGTRSGSVCIGGDEPFVVGLTCW
jgi:hypothetical protein